MDINQVMIISLALTEFDQHIGSAGNQTRLGIFLQQSHRFLNTGGENTLSLKRKVSYGWLPMRAAYQ